MGNTRQWTTKFNSVTSQLRSFLKDERCTSASKRKAAIERAATMPNRLPQGRRAAGKEA